MVLNECLDSGTPRDPTAWLGLCWGGYGDRDLLRLEFMRVWSYKVMRVKETPDRGTSKLGMTQI